MAFTKIQPQQVQLATFLSPSGDLTFTDNVTGVSANLSRSLAGNFNFSDSLTVSSNEVIITDATNSSNNSSITLGGVGNVVSGSNNVLVNGSNNTNFSGSYNVLVNGVNVDFGASGQNNTILAGDQVSFGDQTTGAVILADHETSFSNNNNHSLVVSFASGTTFENGDIVHNGDAAYFNSHLQVNDSHSGIFSGNVHVGGTLDVTGATQFAGSVDMDDPLTLHDGSQAASQTWVDETGVKLQMGAAGNSAFAPYLDLAVGTSFGTQAFSKMAANDTLSGHLLVDTIGDPDRARLVFTCNGFTGVMNFDAFQTGHV